jgi:hypothetical protein
MRSRSRRRCRWAVFLAVAMGRAHPSAADVIDRILAVVDGRPLMLSEVRLLQRVRGVDEGVAVEALIDERLMLREAAHLPQAAVSAEDEDKAYASLLALHPREVTGVPEPELRRLTRRQSAIVKYVEFRFRPQVRISDEEVRKAYDEEYAGRADAPAYNEVAAEITQRLAARALDERIEAWIRELRGASEIRYNR